MKLFLTSAGLQNPLLKETFHALCNFTPKNILYIITAAKSVGGKPWVIQNLNDFSAFGDLDIIDLAGLERDIFQAKLDWADVLVFGGGEASYLISRIYEKGYEKIIRDVIISGKIYVGLSAGSIVACESLWTASECMFDTNPDECPKGLGLSHISFRPHLNAEKFPKIREAYLDQIFEINKTPFYAVDDDTALLIEDGNVSVIGSGVWKHYC